MNTMILPIRGFTTDNTKRIIGSKIYSRPHMAIFKQFNITIYTQHNPFQRVNSQGLLLLQRQLSIELEGYYQIDL